MAMGARVRRAGAAVVLGCAASAGAQVTWVTSADGGYTLTAMGQNGLGEFVNHGTMFMDTTVGFIIKTDFTYRPLRASGTSNDRIRLVVSREFEVGPLPVRWTTVQAATFKLANGGGTITQPASSGGPQGVVYDVASGQGLPAITTGPIIAMQDGNGFVEIDSSRSNGTFILGSGLRYRLELNIPFDVVVSEPVSSLPAIAVTVEAGKISSYAGFRIFGDWAVVPAPQTGASLVMLGAGLGVRRRRASVN